MQRIKAQKQDELELNESSISNVHAVNIKSVLL